MAKFTATQDSDSAAMELKMTPLIDVIFQLLIFLMCALHFRSLETKLEAFLPAETGIICPINVSVTETCSVKITLIHNDRNLMAPLIKLDNRTVSGYEELTRTLKEIRNTTKEISVTIEPQGKIPTQCVAEAIDACKKAGVIPKLAK